MASTLNRPSRDDACWRVSDSFSHADVDQSASKPKYAEDLSFVNWGRPPPTQTTSKWHPGGQLRFDNPIRFPDGLELRLKLDGKVFVARTSVSDPPDGSGLVNPLIYWEILQVTSEDLGLLSTVVVPTAGPSPGPAFKALFSILGKADSAYRKLKLLQFLGFTDVLVLAHIDHAFQEGRGSWKMPAPFLLDQQKYLSSTDRSRLNYESQDLRRYLHHLITRTIRLSAYGLHPDCMRAAYELRMIAYKQMPLGYKYGDRSK